jgi:integrase
MKTLMEACEREQFAQMLLFMQFEYYTLARPMEICCIQVKNIDLKENRIMIAGDTAKGRSDEYVGIPARFKDIISKSGILNSDPNDYVFSRDEKPGAVKYQSPMTFWKKNVVLLERTGLDKINENFSLYSYKHSGAISLYLATKDIKLLQRQCRHKTVGQTEAYLRDLGLMSGLEALNGWDGAI